ncbi:hypothetical protein [Capnocytophaga bilenii]|uniref:hypothetical protein n=1 Tax=Capnocytophaga bilenii TaxID=2819369 RepID=UPI0028D4AD37|nr:hypothetical protein [Capnocytophaga bilenii]
MKRIRKLANEGMRKSANNPCSSHCPHKHKETRTIAHYCTVEVTAIFCKDCGKQLTKEQWEA